MKRAPAPADPARETSLLALVADDDVAARMLAVWVSMSQPLGKDAGARLVDRAVDLGVATDDVAEQAAMRLEAAELLIDRGTTDLGRRWLQTVASRLLTGRARKRRD